MYLVLMQELWLQVGIVKKGLPYIMFGDGRAASCKPISEADLARFMAECVSDRGKINQILPIGGAFADGSHSCLNGSPDHA